MKLVLIESSERISAFYVFKV